MQVHTHPPPTPNFCDILPPPLNRPCCHISAKGQATSPATSDRADRESCQCVCVRGWGWHSSPEKKKNWEVTLALPVVRPLITHHYVHTDMQCTYRRQQCARIVDGFINSEETHSLSSFKRLVTNRATKKPYKTLGQPVSRILYQPIKGYQTCVQTLMRACDTES